MNSRKNAYDFRTNRDRDAFGEVLKRTDLTYSQGEFYRIEFASDTDKKCRRCDYQYIDVRIVMRYPGGFGSDGYCIGCFNRVVEHYMDDLLNDIIQEYHEYNE
jgi:hypothetical protein